MDKEGAGCENQGWQARETLGQFLKSPAFWAQVAGLFGHADNEGAAISGESGEPP